MSLSVYYEVMNPCRGLRKFGQRTMKNLVTATLNFSLLPVST